VTILRAKQKTGRQTYCFYITEKIYTEILDRYVKIFDARVAADAASHGKPANDRVTAESRFFMYLSKEGELQNRPMGINALAKTPQAVAISLGLENPEGYTGHCWRRTGATTLADTGCSLIQLKQSGGWASSTTAEGYVADSAHSKRTIAEAFAPAGASRHVDKFDTVTAVAAPTVYNFGVTINMSGSSNCCPNVVLPTSFMPPPESLRKKECRLAIEAAEKEL
jgi:hypothetical protein